VLSWGQLIAMPGLTAAAAAVQRYLMRGWGWVYLWGDPGPGKTFMLKTAVAEFIRGERSAALVTWADLLAHLRAGYADDTYDERLQHWRTVRLLAIDEMGRAKESDWVTEVESRLLNYRYEQGAIYKRSLTLFASNLPETAYDEWLASRLRDGRNHVVHVESPDLRPAMEIAEEMPPL
jgi:DNA replication protein DnaC